MRGLLFSQMDPPPELEAEFHDWYDTEHIPVRLVLPGFGWAVRYRATGDETRYLVCYFIDDLAVLDSAAYGQIKRAPGTRTERMLAAVRDFTRFTCELVADTGDGPAATAPGDLMHVHAMVARPGAESELEQAYEHEAGGLVATGSGPPRVQLYRAFGGSVGGEWTHLALHEAADGGPDRSVLSDPAVAEQAWWTYRAFHRAGPPTSTDPAGDTVG